ncbi:MAG: hypothetical protein IPN17_38590 [Deltaproteobacteria bacterium]|nr:hypothetical protein [Deltaproteobacteria bacterium]
MKPARLLRFALTLGAAFVLAPGCHETHAAAPDAHVHELDAALDVDNAPETSAHDAASADAPRDRSRDLELRLGNWTAERGRRAEFRLVGREGSIDSLVVLRAVTTGTERFLLAGAMGASPSRLDWYIDRDGDGRFGPSDTASHAPAPTAPPYLLTLSSEAVPGEPAPLPAERVDLVGNLRGFEVHEGVRFDLTVTEVGSERTVAIYRDEAMGGVDAFTLRLADVLRPGVAYRVFLFIDLNDNGVYDLRGDHGSGIEGTATAAGLTFGHDHNINRSWWE